MNAGRGREGSGRSVFRGLAAAAAFAGGFLAAPAWGSPCEAPDNLERVTGDGECLVIQTFGAAPGNRALVVFIHGDGSKGGPSDYLAQTADRISGNGVTGVVLIRPGYHDSDGRKSTGRSYRKEGDGYRQHIVASVADAVQRLKAHHGAERVVLAGHSGGAAISGVILGKYPGLAAAAVLAACPCDIARWRSMRGRRAWNRSLSPHSFAEAVPAGTAVVALTGSKDRNTRPVLGRDYAAALAARGLAAEFMEVPDVGHKAVTRTRAFREAVIRLSAGL